MSEYESFADVILCPASPGTALPLNTSKYWAFTSQWNVLDYPAIVFPVTKADLILDAVDKEYKPKNEWDQYLYDLCKA